MEQAQKFTIYFDGSCPLCRREIGFYQKRTGDDVDYVNVAEDSFAGCDDLSCDLAMRRFHIRKENGELLDGGAAFIAVWGKTPGFRWLVPVFSIPGMTALANWGYDLFLNVRPYMQRLAGGTKPSKAQHDG